MARRYRCGCGPGVWLYLFLGMLGCQLQEAVAGAVYWGHWTQWSACSAQCESGISTRTRQCLPDSGPSRDRFSEDTSLCRGLAVQTKMCYLKECPPDQPTARQLACSQYNSRIFSGRQYSWEPFLHATDPCKMACRAKGQHFYANLADRVENGTPCSMDPKTAVCIEGVCKKVGCDGVVESAATRDKCGVCEGDDSSCSTISGIFTSTELKHGVNYIISIPSGSTNINITELQISRNQLLLETSSGKAFINGDTSKATPRNVLAAGTVFTYGAKNQVNSKESIFSPGPTNETLILKLILRGPNSGIVYTFNVPKVVSQQVLQQIRHHSRPVELPPEPSQDHHQHSIEEFNPSSSDSPSEADEDTKSGFEQRETLVSSLDIFKQNISEGMTVSEEDTSDARESEGKLHSLVHAERSQVSSRNTSDDDLSTKSVSETTTTEQKTVTLEWEPGQNNDKDDDDNDLTMKDWDKNARVQNSTPREGKEDQNATSQSFLETNEALPSNNDDDDNNNLEDGMDVLNSSTNNGFQIHGDKSTHVPERYTIHFFNDSFYANEEDAVDKTEAPLFEVTEVSQEWSGDKNGDETTTKALQYSRSSSSESIVSGHIQPSLREDSDKQADNEADEQDNRDIPVQRIDHSKNVEESHQIKTLDRPQSAVTTNDSRTSSVYDPMDSSHYKIPKYSQSFTFANRYKDRYRQGEPQRRAGIPSHKRTQHSRDKSSDTGHALSEAKEQSLYKGKSDSDQGRSSSIVPRTPFVSRAPPQYASDERGNSVSAFGEEPKTSTDFRHQENLKREKEHVETRERQLRQREIQMEERRRRVEEQRLRYQERLREYQERLRQRQAEIDAMRRRNSLSLQSQEGDSRTGKTVSQYRQHQAYGGIDSSSASETTTVSFRHDVFHSQTEKRPAAHGNVLTDRHAGTTYDRTAGVLPAFPKTDYSSSGQRINYPYSRQRQQPHSKTGLPPRSLEGPDGRGEETYRHDPDARKTTRKQDGRNVKPIVVIAPPHRQDNPSDSWGRLDVDSPPSRPQYIPGSSSLTSALSALSRNDVPVPSLPKPANYIPSSQFPVDELPGGSNHFQAGQVVLNTDHYEWKISGLTECTLTCGGGFQQTVTVCVDRRTHAVVTDENCRHVSKPSNQAVQCNKRPCPAEWTAGPWSPCSVTCGQGEQTRAITCQARVSPTLNLTMAVSSCEGQEQLPNRQACNSRPCTSWQVGNWSDCSSPCGDGERTRDVQCVDLEQKILPGASCPVLKPSSEEPCNLGQCGKGWFYTEWPDQCPVQCGKGETIRKIFCASEDGQALPDNRCDENQRPAASKSCRADIPCGGVWFTGQWSSCDATCGTGKKKRDVLCIKTLPGHLFTVVSEENCEGTAKPLETELCPLPTCPSEWYMTSWTQCSQSCETGYRTRDVKCLDPEQKPSDKCPLQKKPKTRDTCNSQSCAEAEVEETDPDCEDKYAQCRVVMRARLCHYSYYRTICCKSCSVEEET